MPTQQNVYVMRGSTSSLLPVSPALRFVLPALNSAPQIPTREKNRPLSPRSIIFTNKHVVFMNCPLKIQYSHNLFESAIPIETVILRVRSFSVRHAITSRIRLIVAHARGQILFSINTDGVLSTTAKNGYASLLLFNYF